MTPTTTPPIRKANVAAPHDAYVNATIIGTMTSTRPNSNSSHLFMFYCRNNVLNRFLRLTKWIYL